MKRILLTGATGFIGRNILPILRERYDVLSPSRALLNLKSSDAIERYITQEKIDVILHCANPNPVVNALSDHADTFFEDSLRMFSCLAHASRLCERMIFLGSGAEYDKRRDISHFAEQEIGKRMPADSYGLAKYLMNAIASGSENIYNMRVFGCYGPSDHGSKFITHAINCCLKRQPVTVRQDCLFDYMHVFDAAKLAALLIDGSPRFHDYNCCSGTRVRLSEIAAEVCRQLGNPLPIELLSPGDNLEYTGDNGRLLSEFGDISFIPLSEGISMQINYQKNEVTR